MTTPTAAAYSMLAVPEAQRIVLAHTPVLDAVDVGLQEALGSVLAEDVVAKEPLPPFPASIKDGYAVVASDGPGWYPVVGDVRAGNADEIDVQPGSVAYITTGAPIPKGADAVVMVEKTQLVETSESPTGKSVRIDATATPGLDIRPVGCDITSGQVVLSKGEMVGVAEVGLLATVGATEVRATRRPVVAVMSTGDELVEPAVVQLGKGQIRDSNRVMLLAAAASAGAQVHDLGIAGDEEQRISSCLARAVDLQADVVISSGGVSMGDKDLVKALLERSGTVHFGKVKMKPGKPLTFATMEEAGRRILFFGLPGNPVSSLVTFNLAVRPCLDKMRGCPQPELRRIHARTSTDLRLDPERPEYHRATARWESLPETEQGATKGEFRAVTTGIQASSRLLSARSANVLLELPQGSGVIPAGTVVSALVIDDLRGMPNSET